MLRRNFYLLLVLMVSSAQLLGCNSITGAGDAGASSDPDSDDVPGSNIGHEDPDSGSGGGDPDADPADAEPTATPEPGGEALPDFSVADVNADSPRYQAVVSPRDYLGQVSAWYFGHST